MSPDPSPGATATVAAPVAPSFVREWRDALQPLVLSQAAPDPARAAVFSADMVVGFCHKGNLSSPRVGALVDPVVTLLRRAWAHGIQRFVLLQDTHRPDATEFASFPPHCVAGTEESETVPELASLPFAKRFVVVPKNSLHPALDTSLDEWVRENDDIESAIVVGNCTDLCVYQLAMHLRLRANARNLRGYRVIVVADAVDTYDLPEETARDIGAYAHPGNFFHDVFLYHLGLNGVEVVRGLR